MFPFKFVTLLSFAPKSLLLCGYFMGVFKYVTLYHLSVKENSIA